MTTSAQVRSGRWFIGAVGLAGFGVVLFSVARLSRIDVPLEWIAFSLLTFASGAFTLRIPSLDVTFSVSEIFAFSCVLLYGPEMAAVTVAIDLLLLSWRLKHSTDKVVFNFGTLTTCVWLSGTLFFAMAGIAPLIHNPLLTGWLVIPLGVMAATYFLINSGLMAAVIGLSTGVPAATVWRQHLMGLAPSYAAGASVALLLVVALRQVHFSAILLIPPLVLVLYLTIRSSFGRLEDAKRHVDTLNQMYLSTIETLATAIDAKDEVTHGHIRRVQTAAVGLARELGVTDEHTIKAIEAAALLHDTGKIAVPEHILNKPGKLTPAEFEKMKLHAPIGAEILSSIDFPYPVVPIVRHHHENWDGTGYPDKLKGTDIPIGARILSVVDCYDALTSDRPYRPAMSEAEAFAILEERRGRMYDPVIVDAFERAYTRIMPTETALHPAARAVGGARARRRDSVEGPSAPIRMEPPLTDELLGVTSLARAVAGEADAADVGALSWMVLRQVLPCSSMGLFVVNQEDDTVVGRYAAGCHAAVIRKLSTTPGDGIVGWVAANTRTAVNAEPALDYGHRVATLDPPLLSSIAVPLIDGGSLIGVLAVYATARGAFTDDHARLLELLATTLAATLASVSENQAVDLGTPPPENLRTIPDLRLLKGHRVGMSAG